MNKRERVSGKQTILQLSSFSFKATEPQIGKGSGHIGSSGYDRSLTQGWLDAEVTSLVGWGWGWGDRREVPKRRAMPAMRKNGVERPAWMVCVCVGGVIILL